MSECGKMTIDTEALKRISESAKCISDEIENMINGQTYLVLNGEKIDVYVSHEETNKVFSRSGRFPVKKRKFTVIEI